MQLFPFQQEAVNDLMAGKHIVVAGCGSGKTAIALSWAERKAKQTGKKKLLVVTTAAKSKTSDWQDEASRFTPVLKRTLTEFEVVSWHMLKKWTTNKTPQEIEEYLVIFDECLPADTKVETIEGVKELADIKVGDKVLSYNHDKHKTEYKMVTRTIKKEAPEVMYRLHLSNGTAIISTGNHPHYTSDGYKEAKDIKEGDTLYELHDLWKSNRPINTNRKTEIQLEKERKSVLFNKVWSGIHGKSRKTEEARTERVQWEDRVHLLPQANGLSRNAGVEVPALEEEWKGILLQGTQPAVEGRGCKGERWHRKRKKTWSNGVAMHYMWNTNQGCDNGKEPTTKIQYVKSDLLLREMLENSGEPRCKKIYDRTPRGSRTKNQNTTGKEELAEHPRECGKGYCYEKENRVATSLGKAPRAKRWEWLLHRASIAPTQQAKQDNGRVGDGDASLSRQGTKRLSDLLQIRYRKRKSEVGGGVRWIEPYQLKNQSKRQEEGKEIRGVRVESIEVLKLRDIKRSRLYREPNYVCCIDVEDNHNFFANGMLTHNCAKAKAGVSSLMGRAFLLITKHTKDWIGASATPGENWLDYYPYFQAAGKVKHKTAFMQEFTISQRYPFPKVLRYIHEDVLQRWWDEMMTAPDTSEVMSQLPKERTKVVKFPAPKGYKKVERTSRTPDGEFLDSTIALYHHLRCMCNTQTKLDYLSDILQTLSSPLVIFYNYVSERESILELADKLNRKVWRVDGEVQNIPTESSIGSNDIVLCHYMSGSEALNLQFCHNWLSYSYNWSYGTSVQAKGRIKRVGQKHPMMFWMFETEGTVEMDIKKALTNKSDFAEDTWKPRKEA